MQTTIDATPITEPDIERETIPCDETNNKTLYRSFDPSQLACLGVSDIYSTEPACLAQAMTEVIKLESPVHLKRLTQVVLGAYGISRSGTRIQRLIDAAVELSMERHRVIRHGDFLYHADIQVEVRNRSHLPSSERKLDWVSDCEIGVAISTAVSQSYRLNDEDAISMALDMLGFSRATPAIKKRVSDLIEQMLEEKVLQREREMLKGKDES